MCYLLIPKKYKHNYLGKRCLISKLNTFLNWGLGPSTPQSRLGQSPNKRASHMNQTGSPSLSGENKWVYGRPILIGAHWHTLSPLWPVGKLGPSVTQLADRSAAMRAGRTYSGLTRFCGGFFSGGLNTGPTSPLISLFLVALVFFFIFIFFI